jgi:hypothetical protein
VQALAGLNQLEYVALDGANQTDEGLRVLTSLTNLKELRCYDAVITDASLESIAAMSGLEIVALEKCDAITGTGLAQLSGLKSLQTLLLTECPGLTEGGLAELGGMQQLSTLSVIDSPISKESAVQLKATMPSCRISFGQSPATSTL